MAALRVFAALALIASASATMTMYTSYLNGLEASTTSSGYGHVGVWHDSVAQIINSSAIFRGLTGTCNNVHIHGPGLQGVSAAVVFPWTAGEYTSGNAGVVSPKTFAITTNQLADLVGQLDYLNVHSTDVSAGEIRGQLYAQTWRFSADLTTDQQTAAVTSQARGRGWVTITNPNTVGVPPSITFHAYWWGLTGAATAAHFHNAFKGFDGAVIINLSSLLQGDAQFGWIPSTTQTITVQQLDWFVQGQMYYNIHTTQFGAGEIRGQIWMANSVPLTAGTYGYTCKAHTSLFTLYESVCITYSTSGMAVVNSAVFADAACTGFIHATKMNATVHNAGVNQYLQRANNALDKYTLYPHDVTYATVVSGETSTSSYGSCNTCAGDVLTTYKPFSVRRACGTNAGLCGLLSATYANGLSSASTLSLGTPSTTASTAFTTTGTTYTDTTYSALVAMTSCTDFIAAFPKSGASAVAPSMLVVLLAALVAVFRF